MVALVGEVLLTINADTAADTVTTASALLLAELPSISVVVTVAVLVIVPAWSTVT